MAEVRRVLICALLLAGCPEPECSTPSPSRGKPDPCRETVERRVWTAEPDYGADPVVGVCWRRFDRGAVPVPCAPVLAFPEFASVRDCPAFKSDGGTR